tara:strand:- start:1 stop:174 length:174 start_codon:yes stop_codon:yes gene_type:complete
MTITYKLHKGIENTDVAVFKKIDGQIVACIPIIGAEGNIDYEEYLEWAKTNTAEPAD